MTEKFCTTCGHERIDGAKFCGNCGNVFPVITSKNVTETAVPASPTGNSSAGTVDTSKRNSMLKTLPNIIVNVIVGILILFSNSVLDRQVSWGGGESYLMVVLVLLIGFQILAVLLQKKRKSYSLLLPTLVSFISIFPTFSLYREFQLWLEYQGYQTQAVAGGDTTLILICLLIYIAITVLNIIFLFIPKRNISTPS